MENNKNKMTDVEKIRHIECRQSLAIGNVMNIFCIGNTSAEGRAEKVEKIIDGIGELVYDTAEDLINDMMMKDPGRYRIVISNTVDEVIETLKDKNIPDEAISIIKHRTSKNEAKKE